MWLRKLSDDGLQPNVTVLIDGIAWMAWTRLLDSTPARGYVLYLIASTPKPRPVLTEGIHELEPLGLRSDRGLEDTGGCRQVAINRSELWSADGQCVQVDGGGDKDLLELRHRDPFPGTLLVIDGKRRDSWKDFNAGSKQCSIAKELGGHPEVLDNVRAPYQEVLNQIQCRGCFISDIV